MIGVLAVAVIPAISSMDEAKKSAAAEEVEVPVTAGAAAMPGGTEVVLLATFVYHTWSWFNIMPKTMPILFVGGKRLQPGAITAAGLAAAAVACLAVLLVVRGLSA